jgi:hypothetical protein
MGWKQGTYRAIGDFVTCVIISAIIYMFVVVENEYQNLLNGKADIYTVMGWIIFLGFLIFILVEISPPFRKFLFRMHGAEEQAKKE